MTQLIFLKSDLQQRNDALFLLKKENILSKNSSSRSNVHSISYQIQFFLKEHDMEKMAKIIGNLSFMICCTSVQ